MTTISDLDARVKAIAENADADVRKVYGKHFMRVVANPILWHESLPELTDIDRALIRKIGGDARSEIISKLCSCNDISVVAQLAANYLISATVRKRLLDARTENLTVKKQELKRTRIRLEDEREKSRFYLKKVNSSVQLAKNRMAKHGARKRHEASIKAKKFVVDEWALHQQAYKNNKSAFARDYAARVRNEFTNAKGDPLDIKEKTIRELWLSDTPPAGT